MPFLNLYARPHKSMQKPCLWYSTVCFVCFKRNTDMSVNNLQEEVYQQWLHTDLRDTVHSGTLPQERDANSLKLLPSPCTLQVSGLWHNDNNCCTLFFPWKQVNSIIDVGASSYSQLQQIRGKSTEEPEPDANKVSGSWCRWPASELGHVRFSHMQQNEAKGTRMLLLELTDGVTEIYGMEYRPIVKLSTRTPPGTKVPDTIYLSRPRHVLD